MINEQLANHYENENDYSLAGVLSSKSVGGAAAPACGAKSHKRKDSDADKTRGARSERVQAAAMPTKKGKVEGEAAESRTAKIKVRTRRSLTLHAQSSERTTH